MKPLNDKEFDQFMAAAKIPRVEKRVNVELPTKKRILYYSIAASVLLLIANALLPSAETSTSQSTSAVEQSSYDYLSSPTTYTLSDEF